MDVSGDELAFDQIGRWSILGVAHVSDAIPPATTDAGDCIGAHQGCNALAVSGSACVCQLCTDARHAVGGIAHCVSGLDLIEQLGVDWLLSGYRELPCANRSPRSWRLLGRCTWWLSVVWPDLRRSACRRRVRLTAFVCNTETVAFARISRSILICRFSLRVASSSAHLL
jgi:hypothetical protein